LESSKELNSVPGTKLASSKVALEKGLGSWRLHAQIGVVQIAVLQCRAIYRSTCAVVLRLDGFQDMTVNRKEWFCGLHGIAIARRHHEPAKHVKTELISGSNLLAQSDFVVQSRKGSGSPT